jgi:xylulokinase
MSELICVFDIGTTGTRTIIFNADGKEIAKSYKEYIVQKQPIGISEQDPNLWWNTVKETCNQAIKKVDINEITGISAAFLRETLTFLDQDKNYLHPALTWLDEREETNAKDWNKEDGLRRAIPKILWIKNRKPEIFNRTAKICFVDTFIYNKLCGVLATDLTNGVMGILNLQTLKWDEKLAERFQIPLNLWPELHFPGEVIGDLSNEAAKELGLKAHIPIIMGSGDQQTAALGLGAIKTNQAKITLGTGTFVDVVTDKPAEVTGDIPIFSYPSVVRGKWNIEGAMPGTGTTMKWFKDNFSQLQVKESFESNLDVYDLLAKEASTIPPGSEGLLFLPLYMFRKGTIHGLGWNHSRAHMIRAIMESAALSAQMYLQMLEAIARAKISEVRADGGAMNSPLWSQILADITSKKVLIPQVKDGAALGAAILGFCGIKQYPSLDAAVDKMVHFSESIEPRGENVKVYKKLIRIFMPALLEIYDKKRVTKDL